MTEAGFAAYGLDGDFTAAYLAARRVADLAERDPAAVTPDTVAPKPSFTFASSV